MASRRSNEGLEVVPQDPQKYPADGYDNKYDQGHDTTYGYPSPPPPFESQPYEEKYPIPTATETQTYTAGKESKLKLWLIGLAVFLVIAAAIGGSIGSVLANKNKKNDVNSNSPSAAANTQGPNSNSLIGIVSRTSTAASSPTSTGSVCRGTVCHRILSAISPEPNVGMIFALGTDKGLYYKSGNSSAWDSQWSRLGGVFSFPPVAVSWGPGRVDVLGIGTDGAMYTKNFNNSQWSSDWTSLGGVFSSPPAVSSWGPQRLDVFALGTDNAMYHKAYGGNEGLQWDSDWESLQGAFTSPPAVVSWGANRIDIVALGTDQGMWHMAWLGGKWSQWEGLGDVFRSPPTLASWGSDRLDILALGTDYVIWHSAWTGSQWTSWESLSGGPFESEPIAIASDLNRLEVLALSSNDDAIWHKSLVASTWSNYNKLGGVFDSAPAAVSLQAKGLDVFGIGTDAALYHHTWSGGQWSAASSFDNLGGNFSLSI